MMNELKVVIGAGGYNNNPGWLHTEENELNLLKRSSWSEKFKKETISACVAEHVWEHLTYDEGFLAANLVRDYLRVGGHIRCAVPDGFFPNEEYQRMVQVGGPGPEDHPAFDHKIVYTYQTLQSLFEKAGYQVTLLEYFDEQGIFHKKEWSRADGVIFRSSQCDPRNQGDVPTFPSLIIDATKIDTNDRGETLHVEAEVT
ncbi:class I SAM-dependent methyltransferase [Alkalicoccobacillus gibsonii]|uniref:class I SAM-dependent methyltransferase n=1 Tax=Alkalicoccobacillus gibsonii TaxID=79881 RepID=UPI003F7C777C